jgi:hypothetical protein
MMFDHMPETAISSFIKNVVTPLAGELPPELLHATTGAMLSASKVGVLANEIAGKSWVKAILEQAEDLAGVIRESRSLVMALSQELNAARRHRGPVNFTSGNPVDSHNAHAMTLSVAASAVWSVFHAKDSPETLWSLKLPNTDALMPEIALEASAVALDWEDRRPRDQRLQFDDLTRTVTLDGTPYSIEDPRTYQVYKVIQMEKGRLLTKPEIRGKLPRQRLHGPKTIPTLLKKLPEALQNTYQVSTHGYCARLPNPRGTSNSR